MSEQKQIAPVDSLRSTLKQMEPEFAKVLPKHVAPEQFTRVVMTAVLNEPKLVAADRRTLFNACLKSASDGLLPDGREAALVIFGNAVQYLPMVFGIIKKVRNSGELATITAQVVYRNDTFKYWVDGDGEHLNHEPLVFGERGEKVGCYAIARTKDGEMHIEFMTLAQIDDVRSVSKAKNGPAWGGNFVDEMWRKTVIKRLSKRLPSSAELDAVLHNDETLEVVELDAQTEHAAEPLNEPSLAPAAKSSRLHKAIGLPRAVRNQQASSMQNPSAAPSKVEQPEQYQDFQVDDFDDEVVHDFNGSLP